METWQVAAGFPINGSQHVLNLRFQQPNQWKSCGSFCFTSVPTDWVTDAPAFINRVKTLGLQYPMGNRTVVHSVRMWQYNVCYIAGLFFMWFFWLADYYLTFHEQSFLNRTWNIYEHRQNACTVCSGHSMLPWYLFTCTMCPLMFLTANHIWIAVKLCFWIEWFITFRCGKF